MTGVYIFWRGHTIRPSSRHAPVDDVDSLSGRNAAVEAQVRSARHLLPVHTRTITLYKSINLRDMNERTVSEMTSRAPRHLLEQLVLDDVQHAFELTEDKHTMRADH